MKLGEKKEFAVAVLNWEDEIFVINVTFFANFNIIYSFDRAQMILKQIDEAPTTVFANYSDFINVFSPELIVKLWKYIRINNYAIYLVESN